MSDETQTRAKISGYLEKKGRKHMMSCYKKYWFVLEGRLLLYYKSKDEYEAISPCKGSINLGPTSNVKPCSSNIGVFQIESKTNTITLRAETREEQHKWMQALMSALNQRGSTKKLSHFRHSLGELPPAAKRPLERQNTFPERSSKDLPEPNIKIIEKLQKMGAHSYGVGPKLQRSESTLERQRQKSFSDESLYAHGRQSKDRTLRKSESITEDEEYQVLNRKKDGSEPIYERILSNDSVFSSKEEGESNRRSILVDNPAYCSIGKESSCNIKEDNVIYSEPRESLELNENSNDEMIENSVYWRRSLFAKQKNKNVFKNTDLNDNSLENEISGTSLALKGADNIYFEANYETENIPSADYHDIVEYEEIISPRNSLVSSQESNEEKEKGKFMSFRKKNKNYNADSKKGKIKKSESFLQRVWLKKSKNKKNKKEIALTNGNILDKMDLHDEDTIKMLTVLQEILEKKKPEIEKLHDAEDVTHSVKSQEATNMNNQNDSVFDGNIHNGQMNENPLYPSLPPQNQKIKDTSPYHEVIKSLPALPPKRKKNLTSLQIDDILEDLNKQIRTQSNNDLDLNSNDSDSRADGEGKVKALIKRFSIGKEEGVELRKKSHWGNHDSKTYCTDPMELDKLLDELAKVTTAPIMTPGVTSSLINPEVSDTELLKMIPNRRRRISEPDYDIPRPHRSLINLPKKECNALRGTRFFGPILKPSDFENCRPVRTQTPIEDYKSNLPSITPDSLEVDRENSLDLSHEDNRNVSYQSHDYLRFSKRSHHNIEFLVENNLYADPRLLYKSRYNYSHKANSTPNEDCGNVFIDSLET